MDTNLRRFSYESKNNFCNIGGCCFYKYIIFLKDAYSPHPFPNTTITIKMRCYQGDKGFLKILKWKYIEKSHPLKPHYPTNKTKKKLIYNYCATFS